MTQRQQRRNKNGVWAWAGGGAVVWGSGARLGCSDTDGGIRVPGPMGQDSRARAF